MTPFFRSLVSIRTGTVAALLLGGFSLNAFAQGNSPVTIKLEAKTVKSEKGKEQLLPAEKVNPGDTVEYSAACKNTTNQIVTNLQPVIPVPPGTELDLKSIKPEALSASLDGVTFSPLPLKKDVKQANGSTKQELAPAGEYRAVRWSVAQLTPGGSTVVSLRAKVAGPAKAAPSPAPSASSK